MLQAGSSNLTSVNQASAGTNDDSGANINYNISAYEDYIYNAFLFPVNKGEALNYLDLGGPLPKRFAKVIGVRGAREPPDVMEYRVRLILS